MVFDTQNFFFLKTSLASTILGQFLTRNSYYNVLALENWFKVVDLEHKLSDYLLLDTSQILSKITQLRPTTASQRPKWLINMNSASKITQETLHPRVWFPKFDSLAIFIPSPFFPVLIPSKTILSDLRRLYLDAHQSKWAKILPASRADQELSNSAPNVPNWRSGDENELPRNWQKSLFWFLSKKWSVEIRPKYHPKASKSASTAFSRLLNIY